MDAAVQELWSAGPGSARASAAAVVGAALLEHVYSVIILLCLLVPIYQPVPNIPHSTMCSEVTKHNGERGNSPKMVQSLCTLIISSASIKMSGQRLFSDLDVLQGNPICAIQSFKWRCRTGFPAYIRT